MDQQETFFQKVGRHFLAGVYQNIGFAELKSVYLGNLVAIMFVLQ